MTNAAGWQARLVEARRHLHRTPELGLRCHAAAAFIRERLHSFGLVARDGGGESGLLCDLYFENGKLVAAHDAPGKRVLLRADMDGLPLSEAGEPARSGGYSSTHEGVMHACGHDGHVAMLMAAAELLLNNPPQNGSVRLMFQPGEEGPGGAEPMIKAGALDGVNSAFGIHLWNRLPTGEIAILEGPAMAACDEFLITLAGPGGHGAHPAETRDPVVCAAQLVSALHTLISREIPPEEAAVLTVGAIHGGTAFNIIPAEVTLRGTLRSFQPWIRERLQKRVAEMAHSIAAAFALRAEVVITPGYPALVNNGPLTLQTRRWAAEIEGVSAVRLPKPEMGAEDFAYIAQKVPALFAFVGARGGIAENSGGHHSPTFDFDEAALPIGTRLLDRAAREGLGLGA